MKRFIIAALAASTMLSSSAFAAGTNCYDEVLADAQTESEILNAVSCKTGIQFYTIDDFATHLKQVSTQQYELLYNSSYNDAYNSSKVDAYNESIEKQISEAPGNGEADAIKNEPIDLANGAKANVIEEVNVDYESDGKALNSIEISLDIELLNGQSVSYDLLKSKGPVSSYVKNLYEQAYVDGKNSELENTDAENKLYNEGYEHGKDIAEGFKR